MSWYHEYGHSVAISSSLVVVGSPGDDDAPLDSGPVSIFTTEGEYLKTHKSPSIVSGENFGYSLALSESIIVVGANLEVNAKIYVYDTSGTYLQTKSPSDNLSLRFGKSVAVSENRVVVGAPESGLWEYGSVYIFDLSGSLIQKTVSPNDSNGFEEFGFSVSVSGSRIVVGGIDLCCGPGHVMHSFLTFGEIY